MYAFDDCANDPYNYVKTLMAIKAQNQEEVRFICLFYKLSLIDTCISMYQIILIFEWNNIFNRTFWIKMRWWRLTNQNGTFMAGKNFPNQLLLLVSSWSPLWLFFFYKNNFQMIFLIFTRFRMIENWLRRIWIFLPKTAIVAVMEITLLKSNFKTAKSQLNKGIKNGNIRV